MPRPSLTLSEMLDPRRDLRKKILLLLIVSALVPVTVVGIASYTTARQILSDKVAAQLTGQAEAAAARAQRFFEELAADSEVFASAFLLSESMELWTFSSSDLNAINATEAERQIGRYLVQVKERFPSLHSLFMLDPEDRLVASVGSLGAASLYPLRQRARAAGPSGVLASTAEETFFIVTRTVRASEGESLGALVSVFGLEQLKSEIATEARAEGTQLRIVDRGGALIYDSSDLPPPSALTTEGVRLGLLGEDGVSRYDNEDGTAVLGAHRALEEQGLVVLVEMPTAIAFAASQQLRSFVILVSLLATFVITALGIALVIGLTRPIEALISSATEAADGNLTQEIAVESSDQVGYLTEVFNRMIRSLRESQSSLERLSSTDELTGLWNRRHLSRVFEVEIGRSRRSRRPLSVLMLDFDRFKEFNDRYGHLRGDRLLRLAGTLLKGRLRSTDIPARFGGEEFAILLPDTSKVDARRVAEQLRRAFAELGEDSAERSGWVTVSIGVATVPEDGSSKAEVLASADAALYAAKRNGRNRVEAAG